MKIKFKNLALAAVAATALSVSAAVPAQSLPGDQIFNCGGSRDAALCTGLNGYYITVKLASGFNYDVAPNHGSPNSIQGFYVNQCFKVRNVNTGYDYGAGYHKIAWSNAFLSLRQYYTGSC